MDFSVGSCSDSWCVSPSNIGSSPKRSISYSENWRKNVPRQSGGSELQNQEDGPTSQMNPFDRMNVKFLVEERRLSSYLPDGQRLISILNYEACSKFPTKQRLTINHATMQPKSIARGMNGVQRGSRRTSSHWTKVSLEFESTSRA